MSEEKGRQILFYDRSLRVDELKERLREECKVIDVRVGPIYTEIDIVGGCELALKELGQPLFVSKSFTDFSVFWEGRFWEAHEAIEELWREEKDPELRDYYQGLILLSASMIKFYKKQYEISDSLMKKAIDKLKKVPQNKREQGLSRLVRDLNRESL